MKGFYYLILILSLSLSAHGQDNREDVVYLKNGTVYRGTMIEQVYGLSYKIRIAGGSVIALRADEIERITKEQAIQSIDPPYAHDPRVYGHGRHAIHTLNFDSTDYHYRGFFLQTELNVQYAGGGIKLILGYKINQWAFLGAGLGFGRITQSANNQNFEGVSQPYNGWYIPFFIYYSGDILRKSITPFYALQIGYAAGADPAFGNEDAVGNPIKSISGGPMGGVAFGARFYPARRLVVSISGSLDLQYAHTEVYTYDAYYDPAASYYHSAVLLLPAIKIGIGLLK